MPAPSPASGSSPHPGQASGLPAVVRDHLGVAGLEVAVVDRDVAGFVVAAFGELRGRAEDQVRCRRPRNAFDQAVGSPGARVRGARIPWTKLPSSSGAGVYRSSRLRSTARRSRRRRRRTRSGRSWLRPAPRRTGRPRTGCSPGCRRSWCSSRRHRESPRMGRLRGWSRPMARGSRLSGPRRGPCRRRRDSPERMLAGDDVRLDAIAPGVRRRDELVGSALGQQCGAHLLAHVGVRARIRGDFGEWVGREGPVGPIDRPALIDGDDTVVVRGPCGKTGSRPSRGGSGPGPCRLGPTRFRCMGSRSSPRPRTGSDRSLATPSGEISALRRTLSEWTSVAQVATQVGDVGRDERAARRFDLPGRVAHHDAVVVGRSPAGPPWP